MAIPAGIQSTGQINAPSKTLVSRDPADYPACQIYLKMNELSGLAAADTTGKTPDGVITFDAGAGANFFNTQHAYNFDGVHGVDAQYIRWNTGTYPHIFPGLKSMIVHYDVDLVWPGVLNFLYSVGYLSGQPGFAVYFNQISTRLVVRFYARDGAGHQEEFRFGSQFDHEGIRVRGQIVWNRTPGGVWMESWCNGILQTPRTTGSAAGDNQETIVDNDTKWSLLGVNQGSGAPTNSWIRGQTHELSVWHFTNGIPSNYTDAIKQFNTTFNGGYGFPPALVGVT